MPRKDKTQISRKRKKDKKRRTTEKYGRYSTRSVRIKLKEASNHENNLKKLTKLDI